MRRSHVCLACGTDTAPLRATVDPGLAGMVAVCPCGRACLRRADRSSDASRTFWLVARLAVCSTGIPVAYLCIVVNAMVMRPVFGDGPYLPSALPVLAGFFACIHMLAGVWLRAVFFGRSVGRTLVAWAVFQPMLFIVTAGLIHVFTDERPLGRTSAEFVESAWETALASLASLAGSLPALAGYLLADFARRSLPRSSRPRRRLRRVVLERSNT